MAVQVNTTTTYPTERLKEYIAYNIFPKILQVVKWKKNCEALVKFHALYYTTVRTGQCLMKVAEIVL